MKPDIDHKLPLYVLADQGSLTDHQFMDSETLEWLERELSVVKITNLPKVTLRQKELVLSLLPRKEYFLNNLNYESIHGVRHIIRVMFNIVMVCELLGIDNIGDYLIAASIHDLRRMNDRADKLHGRRSWLWFENNVINLPEHKAVMDNFSKVQVMVSYHDTFYEDIPVEILEKYKRDIDIIKSADALDRFRLPNRKWWPKIDFIEIKEVIDIFGASKELMLKSEYLRLGGVDSVASVLNVADQLFGCRK